ncbi:MAG: sensor histidine kinase, partial [Blautia hansenii]
VEIRMRKLTSYVLIEVFDEGIGIPKKDRNKIFQRFYRGEEAREMERDGAGVGLYLARQILEQQGGTICVKDRSGILGSCFHIMLPLAEA